MNCLRSVVLLLLLPITLFAATPIDSAPCAHWPAWLKPLCRRPYQTWTEGQNELYLTGYAWHNRYYYDADRLSRYNENAWGGGLGKSFFDENGNLNPLASVSNYTKAWEDGAKDLIKGKSKKNGLKTNTSSD